MQVQGADPALLRVLQPVPPAPGRSRGDAKERGRDDFAVLPTLHNIAGHRILRPEADAVGDEEPALRLLRRVDYLRRLARADRQRLLAYHVLARLERLDRVGRVQVRRQRDVDDVYSRVGEHLLGPGVQADAREVRPRPRAADVAGDARPVARELLGVRVADRGDPRALDPAVGLIVVLAHETQPENADPDRHLSLPPRASNKTAFATEDTEVTEAETTQCPCCCFLCVLCDLCGSFCWPF